MLGVEIIPRLGALSCFDMKVHEVCSLFCICCETSAYHCQLSTALENTRCNFKVPGAAASQANIFGGPTSESMAPSRAPSPVGGGAQAGCTNRAGMQVPEEHTVVVRSSVTLFRDCPSPTTLAPSHACIHIYVRGPPSPFAYSLNSA